MAYSSIPTSTNLGISRRFFYLHLYHPVFCPGVACRGRVDDPGRRARPWSRRRNPSDHRSPTSQTPRLRSALQHPHRSRTHPTHPRQYSLLYNGLLFLRFVGRILKIVTRMAIGILYLVFKRVGFVVCVFRANRL